MDRAIVSVIAGCKIDREAKCCLGWIAGSPEEHGARVDRVAVVGKTATIVVSVQQELVRV
jgi:hypothetical protein